MINPTPYTTTSKYVPLAKLTKVKITIAPEQTGYKYFEGEFIGYKNTAEETVVLQDGNVKTFDLKSKKEVAEDILNEIILLNNE